ncbi:MAG: DMT family transporter [Reichenbachiella sp.]
MSVPQSKSLTILIPLTIFTVGIGPILVKLADIPGEHTSLYRMLFASIFLYIPLPFKKEKLYPTIKKKIIVIAAVFFTLNMVLWNISIMYGSPFKSTLFVNSFPFWIGLISIPLYNFKPSIPFVLSIISMFTGAYLLLSPNQIGTAVTLTFSDIFSIIAGFCYAVFILMSKHLSAYYSSHSISAFTTVIGTGILFIYVSVQSTELFSLESITYLWLILLGIVHATTVFSINVLLKNREPMVVTSYLLIAPLVTTLLSILLFNEVFYWQYIGALFFYVTGIMMINKHQYVSGKITSITSVK